MESKNKILGIAITDNSSTARWNKYCKLVRSARKRSQSEIFPSRNNYQKDDSARQMKRRTKEGFWKVNISTTLRSKEPTSGCDTLIENNKLKELTKNKSDAQRVYDSSGIAKTLKASGGGQGAKTGLYKIKNKEIITHCLQPRSSDRPSMKKAKKLGKPLPGGSGHLSKNDGTSYCLDSTNSQAIELSKSQIRRLTPRETERLQSFPDDWTKFGIDENGKEVLISDSQRYKMCGNAVTVNVIDAIVRRLE